MSHCTTLREIILTVAIMLDRKHTKLTSDSHCAVKVIKRLWKLVDKRFIALVTTRLLFRIKFSSYTYVNKMTQISIDYRFRLRLDIKEEDCDKI